MDIRIHSACHDVFTNIYIPGEWVLCKYVLVWCTKINTYGVSTCHVLCCVVCVLFTVCVLSICVLWREDGAEVGVYALCTPWAPILDLQSIFAEGRDSLTYKATPPVPVPSQWACSGDHTHLWLTILHHFSQDFDSPCIEQRCLVRLGKGFQEIFCCHGCVLSWIQQFMGFLLLKICLFPKIYLV